MLLHLLKGLKHGVQAKTGSLDGSVVGSAQLFCLEALENAIFTLGWLSMNREITMTAIAITTRNTSMTKDNS